MSNNIKPDNRPPEISLKRIKGNGTPIAKIIPEVASIISQSQNTEELCNLVNTRRKNKHFDLDEESISNHISCLDARANYSSNTFILLSDGSFENPASLSIFLGHHCNIEQLKVRMKTNFLEQHDVTDIVVELMGSIGEIFDAFTGYACQFQQIEFNNQKNLPMHTYDSSKIPCGICWVNYWSQDQVNNIGREKIINAGWYKLVELPNQAIVTATTSELPNLASNPEHLKKFEQISQALDLRTLQEMNKPSKYFQFDSW
jgi:hypothetical protein